MPLPPPPGGRLKVHVRPLDDPALPWLAGREELVRSGCGRGPQLRIERQGPDGCLAQSDVVAVALPDEPRAPRRRVGEDVGIDAPAVVPVVDGAAGVDAVLAHRGGRRGIGVGAQRAGDGSGRDPDALVPRGCLCRRVVHDKFVARVVIGHGGCPGVAQLGPRAEMSYWQCVGAEGGPGDAVRRD